MKFVGIIAFFIALICIGVAVKIARVNDCRSLGHGIPYCLIVWGTK